MNIEQRGAELIKQSHQWLALQKTAEDINGKNELEDLPFINNLRSFLNPDRVAQENMQKILDPQSWCLEGALWILNQVGYKVSQNYKQWSDPKIISSVNNFYNFCQINHLIVTDINKQTVNDNLINLVSQGPHLFFLHYGHNLPFDHINICVQCGADYLWTLGFNESDKKNDRQGGAIRYRQRVSLKNEFWKNSQLVIAKIV